MNYQGKKIAPHRFDVFDEDGNKVAVLNTNVEPGEFVDSLTRSVKSHDGLVEALELSREVIKYKNNMARGEVLEIIATALAAAKEPNNG